MWVSTVPYKAFSPKTMPKTGIEVVSPRPQQTTQNVGLTVPYKAFSPKTMPKTGIEPVSPRPQRGVLTTILLGQKYLNNVSPRPQRGVLTTILLGPKA
ncbi:hypothetical protein RB195_001565 [Necator americanus]|uniref:Uncharacterized protein n=1 Tax=Necator americanus TaxID=51031 RepID=A0ABR1DGC0_NECAM